MSYPYRHGICLIQVGWPLLAAFSGEQQPSHPPTMKYVLVAVLILAIATSMAPTADAATRRTYECAGVRCCRDEFNAGDCIQVQSNPTRTSMSPTAPAASSGPGHSAPPKRRQGSMQCALASRT